MSYHYLTLCYKAHLVSPSFPAAESGVLAALEEGKSEEEAQKPADISVTSTSLMSYMLPNHCYIVIFLSLPAAESGVLAALEEGKSEEEALQLADAGAVASVMERGPGGYHMQ